MNNIRCFNELIFCKSYRALTSIVPNAKFFVFDTLNTKTKPASDMSNAKNIGICYSIVL